MFWTHNDSGNDPVIFAINSTGKDLGSFRVAAVNVDWEDMASDEHNNLYLSDTGNNNLNRKAVQVYKVAEPNIREPGRSPQPLPVLQSWVLKYPDRPFDGEALVVDGTYGYLFSKHRDLTASGVYRFELRPDRPQQTLQLMGHLAIRFPVTGASLSFDRRWLSIMTVMGPFLYRIDGDVLASLNGTPGHVGYPKIQMESCAVTADGVMSTTEQRGVYFFPFSDFGAIAGPTTRP